MARPPRDPPKLRATLDAAERATRQLADACFAAWDAVVSGGVPGVSREANQIMDCNYVASTTARLIAHADGYQLHVVAMQVAVCRRVADRCAAMCDAIGGQATTACARVARACTEACNDVLAILWDGTLEAAVAAHDDDGDAEGTG